MYLFGEFEPVTSPHSLAHGKGATPYAAGKDGTVFVCFVAGIRLPHGTSSPPLGYPGLLDLLTLLCGSSEAVMVG